MPLAAPEFIGNLLGILLEKKPDLSLVELTLVERKVHRCS
jgi:hypothetical protein